MFFQKHSWKAIACFVALYMSTPAIAQIDESENVMSWTSFSLSKKFNKNWSGSYSQLHSIALDELEFNFIQSNLKLTRKVKKNLYVSAGYKPTFKLNNNNEGEQILFNRLYGEMRYTQKLGDFRFQHKIGGEHHFTSLRKFQQRYYYSLKTYYRNKDLPLELRPFFTQKLFYYNGGKPIQEIDEETNEIFEVVPNGLHAYRFQLGVRVSPTEKMNVSLYYMKQVEFNSFLGNDINVENENTGKITAPFYNFGVIGLTMSYRL